MQSRVHLREGRGGLPKDDREAARLYKLAADQGNAAAQFNLGFMYEKGHGVPQDDCGCAALVSQVGRPGRRLRSIQSRVHVRERPGRPRRTMRAARSGIESSPPTRETPARNAISGSSTTEGRGGLPKDDREAARLYKLAADQGNAAAQNNLGVFYEQGRGGLPKDDREAARLYKLAADQGNAIAQVNLGVFYEQGRGGLPKDDREAARLYKLAADQGDARRKAISGSSTRTAAAACRRTSARPRASTSSPPTRETPAGKPISGSSTRMAVAACRRTTARPRASTSSPPTRETHSGKSISGSSTRRAVAACRRTIARPRASTSSPPTRETPAAQVNLGVFYENGRGGLPKDDREAARLYKLAADQGNARAQGNLGVFYEQGRRRPAEGRPRGRAPLSAWQRSLSITPPLSRNLPATACMFFPFSAKMLCYVPHRAAVKLR